MRELSTETLSANEVVVQLTSRLAAGGFHVTRSFDLQTARAALRIPDECPCPHHGTAACTCQYVVLLVSRAGEAPSTLVIHGHDDRTLVSTVQRDERPGSAALDEIVRGLLTDSTQAGS